MTNFKNDRSRSPRSGNKSWSTIGPTLGKYNHNLQPNRMKTTDDQDFGLMSNDLTTSRFGIFFYNTKKIDDSTILDESGLHSSMLGVCNPQTGRKKTKTALRKKDVKFEIMDPPNGWPVVEAIVGEELTMCIKIRNLSGFSWPKDLELRVETFKTKRKIPMGKIIKDGEC